MQEPQYNHTVFTVSSQLDTFSSLFRLYFGGRCSIQLPVLGVCALF